MKGRGLGEGPFSSLVCCYHCVALLLLFCCHHQAAQPIYWYDFDREDKEVNCLDMIFSWVTKECIQHFRFDALRRESFPDIILDAQQPFKVVHIICCQWKIHGVSNLKDTFQHVDITHHACTALLKLLYQSSSNLHSAPLLQKISNLAIMRTSASGCLTWLSMTAAQGGPGNAKTTWVDFFC